MSVYLQVPVEGGLHLTLAHYGKSVSDEQLSEIVTQVREIVCEFKFDLDTFFKEGFLSFDQIAFFGPKENIRVLLPEANNIYNIGHHDVLHNLAKRCRNVAYWHKPTYPDFKPHITTNDLYCIEFKIPKIELIVNKEVYHEFFI